VVSPGHVPSPAILHTRRILREPEEFGNVATGLALKVEYQRRGHHPSQVEHFITPRWALDFGEVRVGTRTQGAVGNGWASLCINLGPAPAKWNGSDGPPGSLSLLPPGGEVDGCTAAGFSYLTVAVPPENWESFLAVASAKSRGPGGLSVFSLPPACWGRLRQKIETGARRLRDAVGVGRLAGMECAEGEALAIECFLAACERAAGPCQLRESPRNRWRLARRADEWMRARLDTPIRMTDLCLAMRVSRRELEYAFRATFEQSPRRHLELLRLNAARRALKAKTTGERSVIRIAHDCGLTHLGRFAASYQALFGEKPSDTLRG
jgi:AraC-like DNA-binding protein